MKKIPYHLGLILLAIGLMSGSLSSANSQDYYRKGNYHLVRSHYDSALVSRFDMKACSSKYLPGFTMTHQSSYWHYGRLYEYHNYGTYAPIQIGIYQDVPEAEESALEYLNAVTANYLEGPIKGISVGDNCWFYTGLYEGESEPRIMGVAFLRKNVFIMVHTDGSPAYFKDVLALCQFIDHDLINGSSYLTLENTLQPLVINSLQASNSVLKLKETAFITVNATDPKGKKLEYRSLFREHVQNDPENVFRITADPDNYFPEPFYGSHIIEFWVVNEDNFFSKVFKTSITF